MSLVGIFKETSFEFPLRSTNVQVSTVDDTAVTSIKQVYYNNSNKRVECHYRFPVYRNATIHDFSIEFAGGKVKCTVEELKEAKKTYSEAVNTGKKAALMTEKTREEYDIKIGNVDAEETVVAIIEYIVHLSRDLNTDGKQFVLPTTITPRYDNRKKVQPDWDMPTVRNPPSLYNRAVSGNQLGLAWSQQKEELGSNVHMEPRPSNDITLPEEEAIVYSEQAKEAPVNVKMYVVETKGLAHVMLPKFNGKTVRKQKLDTHRFFCQVSDIVLGEDFVVTIIPEDDESMTESMDKSMTENMAKSSAKSHVAVPAVWGERYETGDVTLKLVLNENAIFKVNTETKYEFVLVIDRSGSMVGKQISNARHALGLILNALPMDSYFNVYGFGSSWRHFYPKSVKYSKETFEESKRLVEGIQADMGGTDLNGVLERIYGTDKIPGYERRILLLTDGEVYDLQSVFDIVRRDRTVPIFTIGVGNSVSHELISGLAEHTKGSAETVMDADFIEKKVLQQLQRSMYSKVRMTVAGKDYELEPGQDRLLCTSDQEGDFVEINLSNSDINDVCTIKWTDENSILEKCGEGFDSDGEEVVPICEKLSDVFETKQYSLRLQWAKQKIEEMIRSMESMEGERITREDIVSLSKEYGILTKYTAFVGVLEGTESTDVAKERITSPLHPGKYADRNALDSRSAHQKRQFYANAMSWSRQCVGSTPKCQENMTNYLSWSPDDRKEESEDEDPESFSINSSGATHLRPFSINASGSTPVIQKRSSSLPKYLLTSTDVGALSLIFSNALTFDGSVCEKKLKEKVSLPEKPNEECTDDMWASLLFLAYMTVNKMSDTVEWKMTLDKTMNWLLSQGITAERFGSLYEQAVRHCMDVERQMSRESS